VAVLAHPGGDVPGFSRLYFHDSEKAGKSIRILIYVIIFLLKERLPRKRVAFFCTPKSPSELILNYLKFSAIYKRHP
jgi:hypothetical protein